MDVLALDVLPGLAIGVVSMILLVIYYASRPHMAVLARAPGRPGVYGDVERHPDYERIPGVLILRLEGPFFYANAAPVRDRIKYLVGAADPTPSVVIVEGGAVAWLDITSADMLLQLARLLHSAGIDLLLVDWRRPVVDLARRAGVVDELGPDKIFRTVDEALTARAPR